MGSFRLQVRASTTLRAKTPSGAERAERGFGGAFARPWALEQKWCAEKERNTMKYLWKYLAFAIIFKTVCKCLSLIWGICMLSLVTSFSLTSWSWKNSRSLVRLQNPTSHRGTTKKSSRHDEHAFESILRPHPIASRCLPAWHQVDKPQFPTSKYHTTLYAIYGSESNTSISIHQ